MATNTLLGLLMIAAGVALVGGGVLVLTHERVGTAATNEPPRRVPGAAGTTPAPVRSTPAAEVAAISLNPEEKGLLFEKWVVKRFSQDYFTIKEWRGDKSAGGVYAASSKNPDLEIEFRLRGRKVPFAVECKWRRGYEPGEKPYIVWAEDRQIENYNRFAKDRGMPVFVVIGIGGTPDDPDEVFAVSLRNLRYSKATAEYLERFRRRAKGADFFFDPEKPELR